MNQSLLPVRSPSAMTDRRAWKHWFFTLLLFAAVFWFDPGFAQEERPAPAAESLVAQIEARLQSAPEGTPPEVTETLRKALQEAKQAEEWRSKTAEAEASTRSTEADLQRARTALSITPPDPAARHAERRMVETVAQMSTAEIESKLADAEARFAASQQKKATAESESQRRADWRRVDYPRETARVQRALDETRQQLAALPAAEGAAPIDEARRVLFEATLQRLQRELSFLEAQRQRYETQVELVAAERELAAREATTAEAELKIWRDILNTRRQNEAREQERTARWRALTVHPGIKELAESNAAQAAQRAELANQLVAIGKDVETAKSRSADLKADFKSLQERVAIGENAEGLTDAIGALLRKELAELPDVGALRRRIRLRQNEISDVQYRLIELEEQRAQLVEPERLADEILANIDTPLSDNERTDIELAVAELLDARRQILDRLIADSNEYFSDLLVLNLEETEIVAQTLAVSDYIRRRILWIRGRPLSMVDRERAASAVRWLADSSLWRSVGNAILSDARSSWVLWSLVVAPVAALLILGRRVRRQLGEIGREVAKGYSASMWPTIEALFLTVVIALPFPALLAFVSWRLAASYEATLEVGAGTLPFAMALQVTAVVLAALEFLRQLVRKRGVADAHFAWNATTLSALRHHLRWLIPAGIPITFLVALIEYQNVQVYKQSLGRLLFIVGMILLSIALYRILRARAATKVDESQPDDWRQGVHGAIAIAALLGPLAMAVIAALGWYYAAIQLTWRVQATLWLLLVLSVVYSLLMRWLLVARRRLAIKQARERRAAAQASDSDGEAATDDTAVAVAVNPNANLSAINLQTSRLLRAFLYFALIFGAWGIWYQVLPALQGADEHATFTLLDLLQAGVVLVMTLIAARNVPGLLEIALLERLPFDHGARYAISTISRYVTTVVGVTFAAYIAGLQWDNVQWLLAAITVGLGFGLQEIFANFVSGLIILFERPMRVGDVVTIGDVTGAVSRIRIRATTITDANRKELIVPNKNFITGQLVNWTLTDATLRLVLPVNIAYGSDTSLVRWLLLGIADDNPWVLKDPPPSAVFDSFGESALKFELRVYYSGIEKGQELRHQLNVAIDRAFREAGIEIAFPQREIHIRSMAPPSIPFDHRWETSNRHEADEA